jgi:hypothetical protein
LREEKLPSASLSIEPRQNFSDAETLILNIVGINADAIAAYTTTARTIGRNLRLVACGTGG